MGTLQSVFFRPSRGYKKYTYDTNGIKTGVSDQLYQLDGVISEQFTNTVKVTKHPVEYGVDISDHAIRQPAKVIVNGIVTNSPFAKQLLNVLPGDSSYKTQALETLKGERARNAYAGLLDLQNELKPVKLQTGFTVYENMMLTEISAPNDIEDNLKVKLTFEEVFILGEESDGSIKAVTNDPEDVDYYTVVTTLTSLGIAGATFAGFKGF